MVDLDLEKFFDRVNHDILMGLVAKRVADKRLLRLIRGFLTAGVLDGGLVGPTTEGTPQGGPLSPLFSNLMLDVLDRELEKRGHRFVRYADDCNIYVRSRRAGERVMASVTRFLARRLKLRVNAAKSTVDRPAVRAFLGFSFTDGQTLKRRIAPQALARFKAWVRKMTRRTRRVSLTRLVAELSCYLLGWRGYFGFCETPSVLLRSAGVAGAAGVPIFTHLYPKAAAHVMRVAETAHWLKWQDWANPVLREPYAVGHGQLEIPDRPGTGLDWNEEFVAYHLVDR